MLQTLKKMYSRCIYIAKSRYRKGDKLSLTGQIISIKVGKYFQSRIETCTAAAQYRYIHTQSTYSRASTYTKRQLSRFGDLKHAGIASKGLKVNSSQCG